MIFCPHNPDIIFLVRTFRAPLYLLAQHLEMTMERNMFILDCMRTSIGTIGIAGKFDGSRFVSHVHGWLSMILFALFAPLHSETASMAPPKSAEEAKFAAGKGFLAIFGFGG